MVHYHDNIKNFGAPNGLCSSITESKHIAAVKRPWRRSNRYKALSQILKVNERLNKLAAARADFSNRGMLTSLALATTQDTPGSRNPDPDYNSDDGGGRSNNDNDDSNNNNNNEDDEDGDNNNEDNDNNDDDDDDDDDDDVGNGTGPVEPEPLMNEVRLAFKRGKCYFIYCLRVLTCHSTSPHPPIPGDIRGPWD